ncbi:MAG: pilin [Patescibacteria group bacterium]|nr:pilin [Patescibacteria group bacterium]
MKNFFQNKKNIFLIILLLSTFYFLFSNLPVLAQAVKFRSQIGIPPEFKAGKEYPLGEKEEKVSLLAKYIRNFYQWSVIAIAIMAVVMIMISGIQWILAAGNPPAIQKAREQMMSAIIGLVLILLAISLLNLINPALVNLSTFKIPTIIRSEMKGFGVNVKVFGGRGSEQNIFIQGHDSQGSLIVEIVPKAGVHLEEISWVLGDADPNVDGNQWVKITPPLPNTAWSSNFTVSTDENADCKPIQESSGSPTPPDATATSMRCIKLSTEKFIKTKNNNDPFYFLGEYKVEVYIYSKKTYETVTASTSIKVVEANQAPPICSCTITEGKYVACETCVTDSQNKNTGELCMSTSSTGGQIIKNCQICPPPVDQCPYSRCLKVMYPQEEYRPFNITNPIYNNKKVNCSNPPQTPSGCIEKYECR